MYIVRIKGDNRRWLVKEAMSLCDAVHAINSARAFGSIGWKDIRTNYKAGMPYGEWPTETIAHVHQINSDGTERQPYTMAY